MSSTNGAPPRLRIRVDDHNDPVTVHLEGEIDPASATGLNTCLTEIAQDRDRVCLDLSHLTAIDSNGVNALVRTGLDVRPDAWVRVQHPTDSHQLLITIGLGDLRNEEAPNR